ncbi:hypothetical protein RLV_5755 [Rhizobium leguminosarum bv. viciae]|nr:hypothetical protein RLV_5755 [Rhizobium leguminosarum bv. viciae]
MPAKGKKTFRRGDRVLAWKGIESLFEPAKHEIAPKRHRSGSRLRAIPAHCKHIWEPNVQGARLRQPHNGSKKEIQGRNPHYRRKIAPLGITAWTRTYSKIFILALLAGD